MIIADELLRRFEPVDPWSFWNEIFHDNELDEAEAFTPGKYTAIALEITREKRARSKKTVVKRHTITNDLDGIDELLYSENFCIMAPISYAGKSRKSENARVMYALCVELDNLRVGSNGEQDGLKDLIWQWDGEGPSKHLPRPTFCVASGNGIHLYYVFDRPLVLFPNVVKGLIKYKRELTKRIWNRYTTFTYKIDQIQFESIFQAFRMPGTLTKNGERAQAFRTGERVTVDYMNSFIPDSYRSRGAEIPTAYKSETSLAQARTKWPEWYEKRIVKGIKKPEKWDITGKVHGKNPYALYDWWYDRIKYEAREGKRYYCLMTLVIYAIKCDVPRERIERDCFSLLDRFDGLTTKKDNPFTEWDVSCALQVFDDYSLFTYPINSIVYKTGIEIKKNKRNGRKQKDHLGRIRALQKYDDPAGKWRNKDGRPKSQNIVYEWQKQNPDGTKYRCVKETGLDKKTVYKWWDTVPDPTPERRASDLDDWDIDLDESYMHAAERALVDENQD